MLREISTAYQTEEEKKEALLLYFLHNVPMASWQRVAGALHWRGEKTALELSQPHNIHTSWSVFIPHTMDKTFLHCGACIVYGDDDGVFFHLPQSPVSLQRTSQQY